MPVFFILIIIFLLWLTYERKKSGKAAKKVSDEFWDRERIAGYVPKKDTDDVRFITVPSDIIPDDLDSEEAENLRRLSKEQSADLSVFSNTDLKLRYGTSNFDRLSEADDNYVALCSSLGAVSLSLAEAGRSTEALRLLEFADKSGIVTGDLLCARAVLRAAKNDIGGIEDLIDQALTDPSTASSGEYIAERLRTILNNMLKQ